MSDASTSQVGEGTHDRLLAAYRSIMARPFRLGTTLFSVNLVILMMPLIAVWTSGLYENEVLQRVEEKMVQSAELVALMWLTDASWEAVGHPDGSKEADAEREALGYRDLNRPIRVHGLKVEPTPSPPSPGTRAAAPSFDPRFLVILGGARPPKGSIEVVDAKGRLLASTLQRRGELRRSEVELALEGRRTVSCGSARPMRAGRGKCAWW